MDGRSAVEPRAFMGDGFVYDPTLDGRAHLVVKSLVVP